MTLFSRTIFLTVTGCWLVLVHNVVVVDCECYPVNGQNYCFNAINSSAVNWTKASQLCASENSSLPIITSENINKTFQQFMLHHFNATTVNDSQQIRSVWIGLRARNFSDSSWFWTNDQISGLTPEFAEEGSCVAILLTNSTGPQLTRRSCHDSFSYICQNHTVTVDDTNCGTEWRQTRSSTDQSVQHTLAQNVSQCQQACEFDQRCTAIEWSSEPRGCYLKLASRKERYELVRRCNATSEPRCDIVYNSACYDIHRDEVPWFTAVERCRQMNGSLAVFDDNIETYFASSLLFDDEPLWIGLRRSCCTWDVRSQGVADADMLYHNFNTSVKPTFPNAQDSCAVAAAERHWEVASCSQQRRVVCQSVESLTMTTTTMSYNETEASTTAEATESGLDLKYIIIISVVVPAVVIIIAVVVVVVVVCRRRRRHKKDEQEDKQQEMQAQQTTVYASIEPAETDVDTGDVPDDKVVYTQVRLTDNPEPTTVNDSDDLYANVNC